MAILREHIGYYREFFALPEFLQDPVLTFGFQDVFVAPNYYRTRTEFHGPDKLRWLKRFLTEKAGVATRRRHPDLTVPKSFQAPDLGGILRNLGLHDITTLDCFDPRADLRNDMNLPVGRELHARFGTVIDIGSLEHVFDTRQCLENLISMVRVGGHLFLHTPCRGCFNHGLHTLSPECVLQALEINGFDIRLVRFSKPGGAPLARPEDADDVILWTAARRRSTPDTFQIPQQGRWKPAYEGTIQWTWR